MKCKRCGHRTNTINAMRKHYLKKHPQAMRRRKHVAKKGKTSDSKQKLLKKLISLLED